MDPDDVDLLSSFEFLDETAIDEEHLSVFLKNNCKYKGKELITNREVPGRLLNEKFAEFYKKSS